MPPAATDNGFSDVELSVTIMGIRERQESIELLRSRLTPFDAQVSYELTSLEHPDARESAAAAWSSAPAGSTHHLVIQDDVEPGPTFTTSVAASARSHPGDALAFFAEWGCKSASTVRTAALMGAGWAVGVDKYTHTQALMLPSKLARDLGSYMAGQGPGGPPEDVVVHDFLARRGVRELVSVPNLVQHLDLPSMTGNGWQGPRSSVCYRTDATSLIDTVVSDVPAFPFYQWRTGNTWHMTPDSTSDGGWARTPLGPVLDRHGWSPELTSEVLAEGPAELAGLTGDERAHVAGVIQVAVALVMTAGGLHPATDLRYAPGSTGCSALDTLGEGSLRCVLSAATINLVRRGLPALAHRTVDRAVRLLRQGTLRPFGTSSLP